MFTVIGQPLFVKTVAAFFYPCILWLSLSFMAVYHQGIESVVLLPGISQRGHKTVRFLHFLV